MSKKNGSNGTHELAADEILFVNEMAASLLDDRGDVNALAKRLGYSDAQKLADYYGFKNIYTFFSCPGGTERYMDLKQLLLAGERAKQLR